ncbi:hypothetical protein Ahy_B05g076372 isoform B [Arachis hypogaea]|uniref:Uncharacterized protein n=1 Tax=Arachis hypogaea TaxID=3818 RepID=A0A444Z329_ARAHY|nr:hypothetical protein Ahy_B05g076372 isoform B [Arachis hypogaea]
MHRQLPSPLMLLISNFSDCKDDFSLVILLLLDIAISLGYGIDSVYLNGAEREEEKGICVSGTGKAVARHHCESPSLSCSTMEPASSRCLGHLCYRAASGSPGAAKLKHGERGFASEKGVMAWICRA